MRIFLMLFVLFLLLSFKYYNLKDYNDYLDTRFIKRKGTIKEIGYSISEYASQFESQKKEKNEAIIQLGDQFSRDIPSVLNPNDKTEDFNRSHIFTGVFLPQKVKNNSINENASVDDALFNPSSDTTRRGLLQNTRITKDAYSIPCSLFTRRDEHNKENEIELKDYDFITKLKKPDSTGNLLKQESLTIDFSEDIKAYRIGNRNINKRFQTEETKKILNMNTKEEKNNVCNSEQNKEFSLKNQGEKEILLIGNSDYTSEFKIIKNEDCKSKEIGKVKEKEKFLYNSVNQKKEFILEPEFDYDIKINFDVYSSEQFKNRLENTNYILNNKSVIEEKLGKKLSEKNSENSPKLLKKNSNFREKRTIG